MIQLTKMFVSFGSNPKQISLQSVKLNLSTKTCLSGKTR